MLIDRRLLAGKYCLHADFKKDLSYKYGRYFGTDREFDSSGNQRNWWCVAGLYDFLEIVRYDSFEELSQLEDPCRSQVPEEDSRRHVLFPFADPAPPDSIVDAMQRPDPEKHPMMVVTKYTLSPLVFEIGEGFGNVLRSIRNLIVLLECACESNPDIPEIAFFGSVSSPDLVSVILPDSPKQLCAVHNLVRVARAFRLAELHKGRLWRGENEKSAAPSASDLPGHACVMVNPILAFQTGSREKFFATQAFKDEEEEFGLRLDFQLRVDCGHEHQVIKTMREICGDEVEFDDFNYARFEYPYWKNLGVDALGPHISESKPDFTPVSIRWDTHLVHGRFRHMDCFAKAWQVKWFNDNELHSWRSLNLLDSITTVSFPDTVESWGQPEANWEISQSVRSTLNDIRKQLDAFADEFLNSTQYSELLNIFNSFHACFFRQDLLGTARDLLPFFKQLGLALGDVERCRTYLTKYPTSSMGRAQLYTDFYVRFQELISTVNRAVRNRIEHRSLVGDPPFPQTLRAGTPKIVSAYTFVVHLCSQLLRGPLIDGDGRIDWADANYFAACVQAGTQGHVECSELFARMREFAETHHHNGIRRSQRKLLSQRDPTEWSARLFLLDVPTQAMLRPELSIVHCMHEIAEISDWILLPRSENLRKDLNQWIFNEVIALFRYHLAKTFLMWDKSDEEPDEIRINEMEKLFKTFAKFFVPYCIALKDCDAVTQSGDIKKCVRTAIKEFHPVHLVEHLAEAIKEPAENRNDLRHFDEVNESSVKYEDKPLMPYGAFCWMEAATSDELHEGLLSLQDLTREVVGDIGQWCSLHTLLAGDEPMTAGERFDNLSQTYISIFQVAREASGCHKISARLQKQLLQRLTIQAAAVLPENEPFDEFILDCFEKHPDLIGKDAAMEYLARAKQMQTQTIMLPSKLRKLKAYGGKDDLGFLEFGTEPKDRLVELFRKAWRSKGETSSRLTLLLNLWAASTRFAIGKLFQSIRHE